jgi:hypothetical protein
MQRFAFLYTHDRNFDELLAQALFGTGTIILIVRSVGDALKSFAIGGAIWTSLSWISTRVVVA